MQIFDVDVVANKLKYPLKMKKVDGTLDILGIVLFGFQISILKVVKGGTVPTCTQGHRQDILNGVYAFFII